MNDSHSVDCVSGRHRWSSTRAMLCFDGACVEVAVLDLHNMLSQNVVYGRAGSLPGKQHAVPRSEIPASILALQHALREVAALGDLQRFTRAVTCGTFSLAYFATTVAWSHGVKGREPGVAIRSGHHHQCMSVIWARICRSNLFRWIHMYLSYAPKSVQKRIAFLASLLHTTRTRYLVVHHVVFVAPQCATQSLHIVVPGRLTNVLCRCCLQIAEGARQRSWLATPCRPAIIRTTEPERMVKASAPPQPAPDTRAANTGSANQRPGHRGT